MKRHLLTFPLIALTLAACARNAPDSEITKDALKNVNTKGLFASRGATVLDGDKTKFGPGQNVPLPKMAGIRGAYYDNYFGYDPLNYFYQLAYSVHQYQPNLVSFVRLSVGSNYDYAYNNYSRFYGYGWENGCQETEVTVWVGPGYSVLRGPADSATYERDNNYQLRIKFQSYQGYQDANAILAIRTDSGTAATATGRQLWIKGTHRSCGSASAEYTFNWTNLSSSIRNYNELTHDETVINGSNQVVTTNTINFQ